MTKLGAQKPSSRRSDQQTPSIDPLIIAGNQTRPTTWATTKTRPDDRLGEEGLKREVSTSPLLPFLWLDRHASPLGAFRSAGAGSNGGDRWLGAAVEPGAVVRVVARSTHGINAGHGPLIHCPWLVVEAGGIHRLSRHARPSSSGRVNARRSADAIQRYPGGQWAAGVRRGWVAASQDRGT